MSGSSLQPTYPDSLFSEYTIAFEGSSLAGILYGVYLVIAGVNVTMLRKKGYNFLLFFTVFQLVITTLYMAMSMYAAPAQTLSIFGISGSYTLNALSPWPSVVVDVAFVLNLCSSDAFLLYRCYIVCMANKFALATPVLIYLVTVGSAIAWLVVSSVPGAVYSTYTVQVTGAILWSCSAAMNICASSLIVARLWMHRQAVIRAAGYSHGTFYLGYISMTLESALLYTVFVIIAMVVFLLNSPLENVFFPVVGMMQVIAPSLIVYRIARGIAFETDENGSGAMDSLRFASSTRLGAALRPIYDVSSITDAKHVSSVDAKQRDSNSFIHEIKDEV